MRLAVCVILGLWWPAALVAEQSLASGDFTATLRQTEDGGTAIYSDLEYSFGGRGLQADVAVGLERQDSGTETIVYGSIGLGTPKLTVRLGKPRLALQNGVDAVLPLQPVDTGDLIFGVSAIGHNTGYNYAASWHRTDGDASVYGLRAGFAGEVLSLYGGVLAGETERVELGSAVTYGAATAGVDVAFDEGDERQSRVFVDYDVSDVLTLGIVGRQDAYEDRDSDAGIGVTAAYDLGSGFLKGGVARAPEGASLVGLSLGFEF